MNRQKRGQRVFSLWIRRGRGDALPCFLLSIGWSVGYKGKNECSSTKPEWANAVDIGSPRATTTQHERPLRAAAMMMDMLGQLLREVAGVGMLGACVQAVCAWATAGASGKY